MPYRNWKYEILADELMVSVNWLKTNGIPTAAIPAHYIAEAVDQFEKAFFYSTLLIGYEGNEADVIHGIRANLRGAIHKNPDKFASDPHAREWRHFTRFDRLRFREILKIEYSPDILAKLRTPYPEHVQFGNFPLEIKVSFNADFETEKAWVEWCNQTSDSLLIYAGAPAAIRRETEFGQFCLPDQANQILYQEPLAEEKIEQPIPIQYQAVFGHLEPFLEDIVKHSVESAVFQLELIENDRWFEYNQGQPVLLLDTSSYPKLLIRCARSAHTKWEDSVDSNLIIAESIIATTQGVLTINDGPITIELVKPFESRLQNLFLEALASNSTILQHLGNKSLRIPQLNAGELTSRASDILIEAIESQSPATEQALQYRPITMENKNTITR